VARKADRQTFGIAQAVPLWAFRSLQDNTVPADKGGQELRHDTGPAGISEAATHR